MAINWPGFFLSTRRFGHSADTDFEPRPPGHGRHPGDLPGIRPVSYTHLDVYKRQGTLHPSMKRVFVFAGAAVVAVAVAAGVFFSSGSSAAPASTFVLLDGSKQTTEDLKGKVTPVSYTHLDVYKRQVVHGWCTEQPVPGAIPWMLPFCPPRLSAGNVD